MALAVFLRMKLRQFFGLGDFFPLAAEGSKPVSAEAACL